MRLAREVFFAELLVNCTRRKVTGPIRKGGQRTADTEAPTFPDGSPHKGLPPSNGVCFAHCSVLFASNVLSAWISGRESAGRGVVEGENRHPRPQHGRPAVHRWRRGQQTRRGGCQAPLRGRDRLSPQARGATEGQLRLEYWGLSCLLVLAAGGEFWRSW